MIYLITTIHILVCLFIIIVVLLQSGKSGDISAAFGGQGSQTAFGPRGAATFLSRATTWCAIVFMMTSLTLSVKRSPVGASSTGSILEQTQKPGPAPRNSATPPAQPPVQPAQQPAPNQQTPAQKPPAQK